MVLVLACPQVLLISRTHGINKVAICVVSAGGTGDPDFLGQGLSLQLTDLFPFSLLSVVSSHVSLLLTLCFLKDLQTFEPHVCPDQWPAPGTLLMCSKNASFTKGTELSAAAFPGRWGGAKWSGLEHSPGLHGKGSSAGLPSGPGIWPYIPWEGVL